MKRIIAYIDGFNLYFGMRSKYQKKYLLLDVQKMLHSYLSADQQLMEIKYFTSKVKPTVSDPDKHLRQLSYLQALEHSNIKIFYGQYIVDSFLCSNCNNMITSCPYCGKTVEKFHEKKTDVNIASEMIVDAFKNRFDIAILVSGDRDLSTPIQKIQRLFHSKKVHVLFPPNRNTIHIASICDRFFEIDECTLKKSQLPDQISYSRYIDTKEGKKYKHLTVTKPTTWE